MVETAGNDGFKRGRNLDKIGLNASDTSELFFDNAVAPPENLLGGEEGSGFVQLMQQLPQERLLLAIGAVASMERAIKLTADYTKERKAFGQPIIEFQNTAFTLAERKTEATIARVFVDWCIERLIVRDLDTVTASMAKWWCSQKQVEDRRRMPAASWRLRLHAGISDLADVRRCAHSEDLRRHQRDHEAADRALAVAGGGFRIDQGA